MQKKWACVDFAYISMFTESQKTGETDVIWQ